MVQMAIANEFMPKLPLLAAADTPADVDRATQKQIDTVLKFLVDQLSYAPYFGGDQLSLADIAVGAALPLTTRLGLDLLGYPTLLAWCDRVTARPAWQQTDPTDENLSQWKRWVALMVERHRRRIKAQEVKAQHAVRDYDD
jgi:glutathione S-transferase